MKRTLCLVALLGFTGCTSSSSPPRTEDVTIDDKDDSITAANVAPKLLPMLAFLRDDQTLVAGDRDDRGVRSLLIRRAPRPHPARAAAAAATADNGWLPAGGESPSVSGKTAVPRVGIEPTTRGFSVRAFSDANARYVEKYF